MKIKNIYESIEEVRDIIAEKFMSNYSLEHVYKAVMYAFIYAALQRSRGLSSVDLLRPLEKKIPLLLVAAARRQLVDKMHGLAEYVEEIISADSPVLIRDEADFKQIIDNVKDQIGSVDYVFVYDCMSLIEKLVASAYLSVKGIKTIFLNTIFLNPVGLTMYMTQQLSDTKYRPSLQGVARYAANQLRASLYMKNPFIDVEVHKTGLLGVEEFADRVAIDKIVNEIMYWSRKGNILVFSDHGYDVIARPNENYLYVVHGFRRRDSSGSIPVLLLSRLSFFMATLKG